MLETSIFSPFPTMFSTHPKTNSNFSIKFNLLSANAFDLDQSKILSFGQDLTLFLIARDKIFDKEKLRVCNCRHHLNFYVAKMRVFLALIENILGKENMLVTSIFSFTGRRPAASLCHGPLSILCPSMR